MPKTVDHARRRREIVSGLWAVIHERGIDGVTFQAVADAADVSVGRIQHYFESKQHLIRAGAREIVAAAEHAYRDAAEHGDPRAQLVALLLQPVPTSESFRSGATVWYAYLAKAASDPWIESFLAEASRGTVDEVARLLRDVGVADQDSARSGAHRLVALSNGAAQSVLVRVMDADTATRIITREVDRAVHP